MEKSSRTKLIGSVAGLVLVVLIIQLGSNAVAMPIKDNGNNNNNGNNRPVVPDGIPSAFTPLSVTWEEDGDIDLENALDGTVIVNKQKLVVNLALQVGDEATAELPITNLSKDNQIFLIKAGASPYVLLDMEDGDGVDILGLAGHNKWLAWIENDSSGTVNMEVATTDPGFYPFVLELEVVG